MLTEASRWPRQETNWGLGDAPGSDYHFGHENLGSIPHVHIELAQQHGPIVLALGKWRQGVPEAYWAARLAGLVELQEENLP